jgi:transcriptional antiterminator RfaH
LDQKKKKWLLAYTKPGSELEAQKNLENQGFKTLLPMISSVSRKDSKSYRVNPMFPRYVFILVDLKKENWNTINSTIGVTNLITFGNKLSFVPEDAIHKIYSYLDDNDICHLNDIKREYKKGEMLEIKESIFKNLNVRFLTKTSKNRVMVLLSILNQDVKTEISSKHIKNSISSETFKLRD